MSDQQEPIEAQDEATPTGTPETVEPTEQQLVDHEKRYNDLRPIYDRTQNELHRYQNDPEFRQELFRELAAENGYQLGEDTGEEYYADPDEELRRELQELKQWKEEYVMTQEQREQAAIAEHYSENKMTEFGIPDDNDRSLSQEDRETAELTRNWIATRAMALPGVHDQFGNIVPDIETAYAEYRRMVPAAPPEPTTRPEVPFTPQGGQENTGVPAFSDNPIQRRAQREALMLEALERQASGG